MGDPRQIIVDLCRQFYAQGWVSGTGGGISVRSGDAFYIAPSGVQKERLQASDMFVLDADANVVTAPDNPALRVSQCAPLFFNAFRLRDAGAVLHSHSINAMLATLIFDTEFRVTQLEMMKGIQGTGFHDELVVPIIDNTARECDLADSMAAAMRRDSSCESELDERRRRAGRVDFSIDASRPRRILQTARSGSGRVSGTSG